MEWISVKDKLPEVDKEVLAYVKGFIDYTKEYYYEVNISKLIKVECAYGNIKIDWDCTQTCNEKVSHWMPLPEPPM